MVYGSENGVLEHRRVFMLPRPAQCLECGNLVNWFGGFVLFTLGGQQGPSCVLVECLRTSGKGRTVVEETLKKINIPNEKVSLEVSLSA